MSTLELADYPARSHDKLRYNDTDRQGHVNNAVFATLIETGRVEVLRDSTRPVHDEGAEFVLARLTLDFLGEITWPGSVDIGTRVLRIGTSSVTFDQSLFQDGRRVAAAETVIVQLDGATRRPRPISPSSRDRLAELQT